MKKVIVCLLVALFNLNFISLPVSNKGLEPVPAESAWIKSEAGLWMGNYNVWYKIDKRDNSVKLSYNKKKWSDPSSEAVWHDKYGRWLHIYGNKLMYSDNGKNWSEITNRTWQDINGTWYRFDGNWDLWEVKM